MIHKKIILINMYANTMKIYERLLRQSEKNYW